MSGSRGTGGSGASGKYATATVSTGHKDDIERSVAAMFNAESGGFEIIETKSRGGLTKTHILGLTTLEAQRLCDFLAVQLHQHKVRAMLDARAKSKQKGGA